LEAGTIILTGTPEGVGMGRTPQRWLQAGDKVAVEIERIGTLENAVE
jgi:2-keto-4-pentenoate hydratase/2-oxohepta-3-ene-1,7-dioic acid hydratase in catechol pathway